MPEISHQRASASPAAQAADQAARRSSGFDRSAPPALSAAGAAATRRGNSGTTWISGVRLAQLVSSVERLRRKRRTIPAAHTG